MQDGRTVRKEAMYAYLQSNCHTICSCLEELACFSCGVVELTLLLQLTRSTLQSKGERASDVCSCCLDQVEIHTTRTVHLY